MRLVRSTATRGSRAHLICLLLALACISCDGWQQFVRDPGGDNQLFTGDPTPFVGRQVIVQFRWGQPEMYGAAIRCTLLEVEPTALVVRLLEGDESYGRQLIPKLERLGKVAGVAGQADVFRVRREAVSRIFEPSVGVGAAL